MFAIAASVPVIYRNHGIRVCSGIGFSVNISVETIQQNGFQCMYIPMLGKARTPYGFIFLTVICQNNNAVLSTALLI